MAAVRLRRAFHYPEDSDGREELDEEEQHQLIQQLQTQNDTRNGQYNVVFSVIPLLTAVVFVIPVFSASPTERFFALLSIVSLATTAGIMRSSPLQRDRKGKKPISAQDERRAWIRPLVPANIVACAVLAVYCLSGRSSVARPMLYLMPAVMLATILLAREVMLSVDLAPLKDLQYEYKGA
ncbi:uncharacterized protein PFLUO_LOCUS8449 [Penicillium psychrofluorescens]|uniref:uncharacterized protein n=1 Tax=Penicillium psychrofluorescens TaxID=3158075 RepID=UPI003CCD83D2